MFLLSFAFTPSALKAATGFAFRVSRMASFDAYRPMGGNLPFLSFNHAYVHTQIPR